MHQIAIISASVRTGRNSHRVALFFKKFIEERNLGNVEILDLKEYEFPVFDERLRLQKDPLPKVVAFAEKIKSADGVIIITPEYNGGYPASLKNVVDLLYSEWKKKPIAIATVSDGSFGGTQVITSLLFTLWKIGAWVVPAMYPVPNVLEHYDDLGNPVDKELIEKRAATFVRELIWAIDAARHMASK
jgi:NAD(P)H-dependent FMN reductase